MIAGQTAALGANHASTLGTKGNYAIVLKQQGKLEEADRVYREVIVGKTAAPGAGHTSTLRTKGKSATCCSTRATGRGRDRFSRRRRRGGRRRRARTTKTRSWQGGRCLSWVHFARASLPAARPPRPRPLHLPPSLRLPPPPRQSNRPSPAASYGCPCSPKQGRRELLKGVSNNLSQSSISISIHENQLAHLRQVARVQRRSRGVHLRAPQVARR